MYCLKKLPKVNKHPLGENSLHLVTLAAGPLKLFGYVTKAVLSSEPFKQCDQIGRNFAVWAIFFALGAFFSEKYRPNDLGAFFFKNIAQNSPK
jgi:hypothetical protein